MRCLLKTTIVQKNPIGATCTKNATCSKCGEEIPNSKVAHTWSDATCEAPKTCTVCNTTEGTALEHGVDANKDNKCDNCGGNVGGSTSSEPTTLATFALGANGSASHTDGSSKTSYSETNNGYTLSITSGTNMYTGARDAKGNSCIKFGASSKAGSCKFTVPNNVTSVVINIAKYKANTSKITINGKTYTLTKNSDNGEYDEIVIDTTTTKTVTLTTISGGYRAMVNTIEFIGTAQ